MTTISEVRRGVDTSGRPLMSTDRFWKAWLWVLAHPRILPFAHKIVPVQGAFMSLVGGGALASAGYHNRAGCWDVRTWNLTDEEEQALWDVCELAGIHFWKRGPSAVQGGMDEHGHALALWDGPLDPGAASQLTAAKNERDGLASNRPDYMRRKTPLVLKYPKQLIEGDDMADAKTQATLARIEKAAADTLEAVQAAAGAEWRRDKAERERQSLRYRNLVAKIGGLADQLEGEARAKVLRVLADEEDVTGEDNPAPEKI